MHADNGKNNVARLIMLETPNYGANPASQYRNLRDVQQMGPGSSFLNQLNAADSDSRSLMVNIATTDPLDWGTQSVVVFTKDAFLSGAAHEEISGCEHVDFIGVPSIATPACTRAYRYVKQYVGSATTPTTIPSPSPQNSKTNVNAGSVGTVAPGPSAKTASAPADSKPSTTESITVVEYADYQCPFSGQVEPTIQQLRVQYGGALNFDYKNFPVDSIHPYAHNAGIAAECARNQGADKFWAYHDLLFQHQDALDVPQLKQYAQQLGLDATKFNTCLDNKETESRIQADMKEAIAHGVQGTPSFWIKDELVVGALPYDNFQTTIDAKLNGKTAPAPAPLPQRQDKVDVAMGSHVIGDKTAKIQIIEFSDYQCPYCKKFFTDTESQLINEYVKTGKVQFSYRNFPLSFHQNAQASAEAAECVANIAGNDAYWKYHDTLFTKGNDDGTGLDAASLKQYAADLKIDATKFASCLDNHETAAAVKADADAGSAAGVSGTPSFYVNGKQLVGAQPFSTFMSAINAASS